MLHRAVLQAKLEESREFAQKVQQALWVNSARMNSKAHDRGVRQAPFVVLIGATMPSILAEIGFVSNPHDEKLMKRSDQREKIAEALLRGVSQYASTLSHTQMARALVPINAPIPGKFPARFFAQTLPDDGCVPTGSSASIRSSASACFKPDR